MFFKFIFLILFINIPLIFTFVHFNLHKSELKEKPSSLISINTKLGQIIGYKQNVDIPNLVKKSINVFYGIPYAESIDKSKRFKKTKIINRLPEDPYEALSYRPHCPLTKNYRRFNESDIFSEDCLHMNIYTPNLELNKKNGKCIKKYQVMIFIYGSNSSIYQLYPILNENNNNVIFHSGELFSALHDTIFVTFNYRQRLFASFYLEDVFPGNLALFDQNLALEFVHKYIDDFCGNENNLNVFGQSFGGNYLSIHLISKYSKDLIKTAIIQSSFPLYQDKHPTTKNEMLINSILASSKLNCLNLDMKYTNEDMNKLNDKIVTKFFNRFDDNNYILRKKLYLDELNRNWFKLDLELRKEENYIDIDNYIDKNVLKLTKFLSKYFVNINCLQSASIDDIMNLKFHNSRSYQIYYDFDFIDNEAYYSYKLFNKLELNPNVNLLIGGLETERCDPALNLKNKYYTDQFNSPRIPKQDANIWLKNSISLFKGDNKLATQLANYYTNETLWSLKNGYSDSLNNFMTDYWYSCAHHYYSTFAAMSANSVSNYVITRTATKHDTVAAVNYDLDDWYWMNCCHADELVYLFGLPFRLKHEFNDLDREFSLQLLKMWTTFAKEGKMSQLTNSKDWPISNRHNPKIRYVEINGSFLRERKFEFESRCSDFWRPLLPFYKR